MDGQRGFRRLKSFSTSPVPVGPQMVVVLKTFVEHCVSLVLGHGRVFCWLIVSQTDVLHMSLPAHWIVHPIVVGRKGKSTAAPVFISGMATRIVATLCACFASQYPFYPLWQYCCCRFASLSNRQAPQQ